MAKRKYGGQFVLRSMEFGNELYIMEGMLVTDRLAEAMVFDERDNPEIKVAFYKAQTGYVGLQAVKL